MIVTVKFAVINLAITFGNSSYDKYKNDAHIFAGADTWYAH